MRCVTIRAVPDLLPGAEIAGCRIEAVAGRGGMGIVYRATQLSLGRPVAVKLIAPDRAGDPGFRERFERESRVAAAIDHPNVIPVYAAGEEGGHLYLVMRYVKGIDLQGLLARERRLPAARVAAVAGQIGAALDAAHAVGLVHRDVKPANVLLSGEHAYLADFGLSQVVGSDTRLTSTGQWIGTVDFMAPEQFSGAEVDARADVYALGCVLYTALTGETPYPRGTVPATMLAHMHDAPPRPTEVAADVPAGFDRVIARALAKDPERRYPSAGDLGRAALAAAEGRHVTESERTVARGAAAPQGRAGDGREATGMVNGRTAATVVAPPTRHAAPPAREHTARKPRTTLPLGDRPRRRRRGRAPRRARRPARARRRRAAVAVVAGARRRRPAAPAGRVRGRGRGRGAGERVRGRLRRGGRRGARAAADARRRARRPRRPPGGPRRGREGLPAPVRRTPRRAASSCATSSRRAARPGAPPRASSPPTPASPTSPARSCFGVLRDRGTPRIALISARQDPPRS